MKLSMSEKESTNVFGTFAQSMKDAAEQRARADSLQLRVNELTGKINSLEREVRVEKENHTFTRNDLTSYQASNGRLNDQLRAANDKVYSANSEIATLKRALEEAQKAPPRFSEAQESDIKIASQKLAGEKVTEVVSLLATGQKIQAIKVVREVTGFGLKEAKDLVEIGKVPGAVASAPVEQPKTGCR